MNEKEKIASIVISLCYCDNMSDVIFNVISKLMKELDIEFNWHDSLDDIAMKLFRFGYKTMDGHSFDD